MITGEPLTGKYAERVDGDCFLNEETEATRRFRNDAKIDTFPRDVRARFNVLERSLNVEKFEKILDEIQDRLSLVKGER